MSVFSIRGTADQEQFKLHTKKQHTAETVRNRLELLHFAAHPNLDFSKMFPVSFRFNIFIYTP